MGHWKGAFDTSPSNLTSGDDAESIDKHPAPSLPSISPEQLASAQLFYVFGSRGRLRFGADVAGASSVTRASWRVVSESEDNVTLEISPAGDAQGVVKHPPVGTIFIQMLGRDRFRLTGVLLTKRTATFRRVTE